MLTKKHQGFLDATEAVQEAFTDIKNHQLAMYAGIQAALTELVERFDPQHFMEHYEEGIVFQKKGKCWDAYCEAYSDIAKEAVENFFGEAFIRTYEKQILNLTHTRRKG